MIKIAFRYLLYRLFAPHRRGFGVHSPFVFNFVSTVLNRKDDENLLKIADWRKQLLSDRGQLQTTDKGAGSVVHKDPQRTIRQLVLKSSIRHKYGRILYRLAMEYKPAEIIEMGTGIGISTAYLAKACPESRIITIEGDKEKMTYAARALVHMGLENVFMKVGSFKEILPDVLLHAKHPMMVFIDGDHTYDKTLEYFGEIKKYATKETIIIFDDIRWSEDMEKTWIAIKQDKDTVICIDLFFMGIVFFRGGIPKQDFVINF
jgi:predicted O-methyltransferase YrrM